MRLRVVAEAGQVSAEAVRLEESQHRVGQLRAWLGLGVGLGLGLRLGLGSGLGLGLVLVLGVGG